MSSQKTDVQVGLETFRDMLGRQMEIVELLLKGLPAPDPPGAFGEPWKRQVGNRQSAIQDAEGVFLVEKLDRGTWGQLDRIITCVNANAGIKNPAAVPELVRVIRHRVQYRGNLCYYELKNLLAALDKAPDAEGGG